MCLPVKQEVQSRFVMFLKKIATVTSASVPSCSTNNNDLVNVMMENNQSNSFINSIRGGSRSVLTRSPLRTSTPSSSMRPVKLALHHLEVSIGTKRHIYINRLIEGNDTPGDSVFLAWRTLYNDWQMIKEKIDIESYASKSSLCNDVDPIINSILKYPSVQRNSKPARRKLELPKHITGKEVLEILKLQEGEKRRAEIVKETNRQKRDAKKMGKRERK